MKPFEDLMTYRELAFLLAGICVGPLLIAIFALFMFRKERQEREAAWEEEVDTSELSKPMPVYQTGWADKIVINHPCCYCGKPIVDPAAPASTTVAFYTLGDKAWHPLCEDMAESVPTPRKSDTLTDDEDDTLDVTEASRDGQNR